MTPILSARVRVIGIHEHLRTVRGRKDPLGQAITEQVSLGWFMHVDLDDGGIAFRVGSTRPADIQEGDELILSFMKP